MQFASSFFSFAHLFTLNLIELNANDFPHEKGKEMAEMDAKRKPAVQERASDKLALSHFG